MARMRKGKLYGGIVTVVVAAGLIWWLRGWQESRSSEAAGQAPRAVAAEVRQSTPPVQATVAAGPATVTTTAAAGAIAASSPASSPAEASSVEGVKVAAVLAEAERAIAAGDLIPARRELRRVVEPGSASPENVKVVAQLVKLADETIFSTRVLQNDPLVLKHVVAAGNNLQKIANLYRITVPLICRINHLSNPNMIRQGQPLKVIHGPFHAVVNKGTFQIFVYCQDTLVRVFPVALGAEDTTPTGVWKIKNKLENPAYYPPRGGAMIAADDPNNPLGEYWMALEGVQGDAVGQERYGIHGTNEPDSVGSNVSMGCIRLRNEDAAQVYEMLVVRDSVITVQ